MPATTRPLRSYGRRFDIVLMSSTLSLSLISALLALVDPVLPAQDTAGHGAMADCRHGVAVMGSEPRSRCARSIDTLPGGAALPPGSLDN